MSRPVTLFTGQWADLPFDTICRKAASFGYDGIEIACWGDHFDVSKADTSYCAQKRATLEKYGLRVFSISNHLVGQAVCDRIDERHKSILPASVWGDGEPDWGAVLAQHDIHLHLYGKADPRPGRKMGHLTCVGPDPTIALQRVSDARVALIGR